MSVTIRMPPALSERIGSRGQFEASGPTIRACLQDAAARYPELQDFLWREGGRINPVLHIFHHDELLHEADLDRPVTNGDRIDVIPAIEGG